MREIQKYSRRISPFTQFLQLGTGRVSAQQVTSTKEISNNKLVWTMETKNNVFCLLLYFFFTNITLFPVNKLIIIIIMMATQLSISTINII